MGIYQPDIDDKIQERIEETASLFNRYLVEFDFNGLDELTTDDFLGWFYDREGYQNEFVSLATRSAFWKSNTALEVATDYAEHMINQKEY